MASPRSHRYLLPFLLLWTASCTEPLELAPDTGLVQITAGIDCTTRTSMSGSTASFAAGDNIGVFETLTSRSNVPYAYGTTRWTSTQPIYWYNGTSNHTFYAYYPYSASNSGLRASIPVLSNQTITTSPGAAWDLLVTNSLTQKRSANVPLNFTHAYALIQLNIKMGILQIINPFYLNRITIQGGNPSGNSNRYGLVNITGNPTKVAYDFSSQSLWAATNDAQSYAQSFYSNITGVTLLTTAITFYAFILPGTYTNPAPAVSLQITTLGILHTTALANLNTTTFQAGTKYVYNMSVGLLTRSEGLQPTITLEEIAPYGDTIPEHN